MPHSPPVRRALPADAADIARVQIAAWTERLSAWAPAWFLARFDQAGQTEKYRARLTDSALTIFVAEDNGQIAGVIGSKPNAGEPLDHPQKIFGYYVAPDREGQGIGTALLRAMLDELQTRRQSAVVFTFAENAPARRRYEAAGGILLPYTDSPDLDLKIPHVAYGFRLT